MEIELPNSLEVVKKSFNSLRIVAPKIACGLAKPKDVDELEYWNNRIKPLFQEINFNNLTICSL